MIDMKQIQRYNFVATYAHNRLHNRMLCAT